MAIRKNTADYYWWESEKSRKWPGFYPPKPLPAEDRTITHKELLELIKQDTKVSNTAAKSAIDSENLTAAVTDIDDTLLHIAAKYTNGDITEYLIDLGANVNVKNKLGKTPIMLAVEADQWYYEPYSTVKLLIETEANIYIADNCGKTALQHVVDNKIFPSTDIVKLFLQKVYDDCGNNSKLTAKKLFKSGCSLERIIFLGNSKVTEKMIDLGCSIDAPHPYFGHTTLHLAVSLMDSSNVDILVRRGANVNAKDSKGWTPLRYYCYTSDAPKQRPEILRTMMNKKKIEVITNPPCRMHITSVLLHGTKESVETLLQYNIDLNAKNEQGRTPLHILARNKNPGVACALKGKDFDVHALDKDSHTPIFYAVCAGNISTFKFFIDNGATVNISEFDQLDRPIIRACGVLPEKNGLELFLYIGLNIHLVDSQNCVPFKTVFDRIKVEKTFLLAKSVLAYLAMHDRLGSDNGKRINEFIWQRIESHQMFVNHFYLCKRRLQKMKNGVIYDKLTLYDLLVEPIGTLVRRCVSSDVLFIRLQKLLQVKRRSNFYYFGIIRRRIEEIVSKAKIIKEIRDTLYEIIGVQHQIDHVIFKIMNYLDDHDMRNLRKVKTIKVRKKSFFSTWRPIFSKRSIIRIFEK